MARKKTEVPFVDPFDLSKIVHRSDVPDPGVDEKRFYYYFYRPLRKFRVIFGSQAWIVDKVDTIGVNNYGHDHIDQNLGKLMGGNARRIYVSNGTATLS